MKVVAMYFVPERLFAFPACFSEELAFVNSSATHLEASLLR